MLGARRRTCDTLIYGVKVRFKVTILFFWIDYGRIIDPPLLGSFSPFVLVTSVYGT